MGNPWALIVEAFRNEAQDIAFQGILALFLSPISLFIGFVAALTLAWKVFLKRALFGKL